MNNAIETIKVLLAEDHVVVRQGTRELLEREPDLEVVVEAGDGEQAVQLAADLKPDVVIMDIAMPRLNGIEATKRIKAILPSSAVLILTGYDYDEYIVSLLDAGAAGYLLKSVGGDELIGAIRAVHAGEPVLHPVVIRKLMTLFMPMVARQAIRPFGPLSERETEVLKLVAKGLTNKDISQQLSISIRTVQAHLRSIFKKLAIGSRSETVLYGLRRGWFSFEELA